MLLALAGVVAHAPRARAAAPDSLAQGAAPADTTGRAAADSLVRRVAADTSAIRTTGPVRTVVPPPGRFDQPNWVMMRSLVIPGWGQFHNQAYVKAGVVAATEGLLIASLVEKQRHLDELNHEVEDARDEGDIDRENQAVMAYNAELSSLTSTQWWLGAAIVYSMLDAYLDAHFRGFDVEFKNDPALPGGVPPRGARLSLRWSF